MSCIDEIVDFAEFFSCTKTKKRLALKWRDWTGRDGALQNAGRDGSGKQVADGTGRDGFFIFPRSSVRNSCENSNPTNFTYFHVLMKLKSTDSPSAMVFKPAYFEAENFSAPLIDLIQFKALYSQLQQPRIDKNNIIVELLQLSTEYSLFYVTIEAD